MDRALVDRICEKYGGVFAACRLLRASPLLSPPNASHALEAARAFVRASSLNAGLYRMLQPPLEDGWASAAEAKGQERTKVLDAQLQLQASYAIREQQRVRGRPPTVAARAMRAPGAAP
jgi:hypothetical protein